MDNSTAIYTRFSQAMQLNFSRPLSPGKQRRARTRRAPDPTPEPGHLAGAQSGEAL